MTNIRTRLWTTWASVANGEFAAPGLSPGDYAVTAAKPGFRSAFRKRVQISVGGANTIDLTLEAIDTGTRPIVDLPLTAPGGRNVLALLALVPGVVRTGPAAVFDAPQGSSGFSINGQRESANQFLLDGAANSDVLSGGAVTMPPPEAVGELRIQSNPFSAEFGRAGSAVIQVTTRSGSNQLHGSAYEFLGNNVFDARGPFDRAALPPRRQHDFGAAAGGPLRRDRTFWFADYSGLRQRAGRTLLASVPSINQRNGVFLPAEGAGAIYDSVTGSAFPGNIMPASRQSAVGKRILDLYPLPNTAGRVAAGAGFANNYTGAIVQRQDASRGGIRVDHSGARDSLFARYSVLDSTFALPPLFGELAPGDLPARNGRSDARTQSLTAGHVRAFRPGLSNEFRGSFARIANIVSGYDGADIGIAHSSGLPRIEITGMAALGADATVPSLRYENSFQLADTITMLHGRHEIKFGGDIRRIRADLLQSPFESPRGRFAFDQNYTSNNGAPNTGMALASVLLGFPASAARSINYTFPSSRLTQTFAFVHDSFRLSRRLTLELGLRYENYPPAVDRWENQSNFDLQTGTMRLAARGGNSRALVRPDRNNWAPRVGFAFALQPRTTLRGGYGISYYPDRLVALNNSYPFVGTRQVTPPDRFRPTPALSIESGIEPPARPDFPGEFAPLVGAASYVDPNFRTGYVQFWSLGVQRQLPWNLTAEASYVGVRGTHLAGVNHVNLNQPEPGPGAIDGRRPYALVAPLATAILLRDSSQWSFYQGLQVKLQKQLVHRLWLLASYTWSDATDNAAASYDLGDWDTVARGPANTDVRHAASVAAIYDLPHGWQVNGIYAFRTGLPATAMLTPALVASTVNTGGAGRPDQVDVTWLRKKERTLDKYFNVAAFVAPSVNAYRYGTATRNSIRGPSYSGLDLSVFKNLPVAERYRLQIRGEVFNVANHPNLGQPGVTFGTTAFGAITSLAANATMRQIQLGLKLFF